MPVCHKCEERFPNWATIKGKKRNLQRRKYCLTCSPFGCRNTRQLERPPKARVERDCKFCGRGCDPRRHQCGVCDVKLRRYRMKAAAVHYLGGKCVACSKTGHPVLFDFHHPDQKDFSISEAGTIAWARVKKELDKCLLLCVECHRLEHTDFKDDFLVAVYDYNGDLDLGPPFLPE